MEPKVNERICVLAWQEPGGTFVSRGKKLHLREDALLMAHELDRDIQNSVTGRLRRPRPNWPSTPPN